MKEQDKFVGRIGLVGISNVIMKITMILLVPILTKNLTMEDYGLWVIIATTVGLVPPLVCLGLTNAFKRYLPSIESKDQRADVFYSIVSLILITATIASLILFLLAGPISAVLLKNEVLISQLLALIIFFNCMIVPTHSFFTGILKIRKNSLILVSKSLLNLVFVAFMITQGLDITGAVMGLAISDGLILIFAYLMVIKEIGIKRPSFDGLREYLSFGIPLMPSSISSWVVRSSDRYLIGLILGAAFVGYYSPAYTLGDVIILFASPISLILFPTLSKYYDEDRFDQLKNTLSHSIKYYLAIAIPTLFGLSILAFPILNILTTNEIASNGYQVTPIVCLGCLFWGIFSLLAGVLMVTKHTKAIGSIWIVSALVNVGLNMILIPIIGIIGAAFTTLVAFMIASISVYFIAKKRIPIEIDTTFIAKSIIASMIMSTLLLFWNTIDLFEVVIQILLCACIYFGCILLMKGFSRKEISFFLGLIPRMRS
jgi:O-antigen/teichoic acid export membrane protein